MAHRPDHGPGVGRHRGDHLERGPQPAHRRRRQDAVPDDIADDEHDPSFIDDEHVVPIPSDGVANRGGPVAGGDGQAIDVGKLGGQRLALERERCLPLGVVLLAPGERVAGKQRHRLEQGLLLVAEDVDLAVGHREGTGDVIGHQR